MKTPLLLLGVVACILGSTISISKEKIQKPVIVAKKHQSPKKAAKPVFWHSGSVTTYAQKFEGRKMASGRVFRHSGRYIACRGGRLGQRVELRYGKNGKSICVIADRGNLPLHKNGCWQFDVSRQVAKDLGLYRVVNGRTDRIIKWRVIKR
jgi:rare lipoprotein A (peptidoglycan hydrolase)